jgi:hypothetical protein
MRRRPVLRSDSLVPRFVHTILAALLVVATAGSAGAGVQIGLNFTGRVNSPPPAPAYFPDRPDAMGAVGEEHIVELLNDGYAVYRKSNGTLVESSTLTEFWRAAGVAPVGLANDPRVLYDAASQRWFAVSIDGALRTQWDPNNLLVAVSKSADPTQGWAGFQIYSDPINNSFWADFPQLGMDAEGLYLGASRFAAGPPGIGVYLGQSLLVFPKADLLAEIPSISHATIWSDFAASRLGYRPQPVVNLDGGSHPATLLSGDSADYGYLQSTKIGGSIVSPVLERSKFIAVPQTDLTSLLYFAAQPGPKRDLTASLGRRFSGNAVQIGGSIWAAHSTRVDGRVAVRWYEIDAATDLLLQSGDLTDPTLDLYYPSIAANPFGQVVIGMSGSSEMDFVGAYAAVGETVGGVTSFGAPLLLKAGLADFTRTNPFNERTAWGDYSATVVDPSDPHRFWTFQEYVEAEDTYGIRITELILTPQCSDGLDNDGDDLIDYPDDLGCDSPSDLSERAGPGSQYQCDDGIDNDSDQLVDYPDDPGCPFSYATIENPQCDDGVDNDGNNVTDFADSKCEASWPYWETTPPACGLGAELVLALPLIALAASRRRRAAN